MLSEHVPLVGFVTFILSAIAFLATDAKRLRAKSYQQDGYSEHRGLELKKFWIGVFFLGG